VNYSGSVEIDQKKVTTLRLKEMKKVGRKISCLTAYDALFAKIFDESGIDLILVGDSLGNIVQGHETTLSVSLEDTIYHTKTLGLLKEAVNDYRLLMKTYRNVYADDYEVFKNALDKIDIQNLIGLEYRKELAVDLAC
jgi:ketopantoate hydroxymethyltransferase